MSSVSLSLAVAAGGLSVLNPCGFPLLPAFLSFYLGADEETLPRTATRAMQGIAVGALVAVGFLGFFVAVGLPVSLGVDAIARTVPWLGLATGAALVIVGLVGLCGFHLRIPTPGWLRARRERRAGAMVLFGAAYGAASLGCTLPLFLTLIGASLGGANMLAFVAYGAGMGLVLMALSVCVALVREGATRGVRSLMPLLSRLGDLLLIAAGGYLFYYWARLHFGDTATVADDPLVSFGVRFSGDVRRVAEGRGVLMIAAAGLIVALAILSALRGRSHDVSAEKTAPR